MFWNNKKTTTGHPTSLPARAPLALPLEPRMMFDGAVAATVADTATDAPPPTSGAQAQSSGEITDNAMPLAATADQRQEVVFIDSNVSDKQRLIDGIKPGVEIVMLDGSKDGLQQIGDYLRNRQGIDAVHILSHGETGRILLGNIWLDKDGLDTRSELLAALGGALSEDGDILLYGCNVGAEGAGAEFIQAFASATKSDIAASNDLTGHSALNGNWLLEVSTGSVEATAAVVTSTMDNYLHILEPADQDFESPPGVAPYSFNGSLTIDGVTYTLVSPAGGFSTITATDDFSITPQDPNKIYGYDLALVFNMDQSNVGLLGPLDARISSADGNEFKLVSMEIDTGANMGTNPNLTVRGFLNGVEVAFDTVNTSSSDNTGSITYTKNAVPGGSGGTLTFSSAWQYIDEIRISGNDTIVAIDDLNFAPAVLPNAVPVIGNLNGDSTAWAGVGNSIRLDAGSNASLTDAELGALNGGNGNWAGASLVIQRNGTAVSSDLLGFDTIGALFTVSGGNLQANGQTFATFTSSNGVLAVNFTSSATTATTALVNDVVQRITYRSDTPAGDANLRVTINDGAGGSTSANVTVASDTIYVTSLNDTATINLGNGVSFSEAVAIAAADSTGSQTIVFASSLAGQTLNLNTVSINESLTFDLDQASGLTLTGGTITLAGGTTQTFTNGSGDTGSIVSVVAGSGALTKAGAGNLTLSGAANSFSGATTISAGTLTVSGGDALSSNSSVSVASGATLALSGSETIGNLSGAGSVSLGGNTLSIVQSADTTFSGNIAGSGSGGLTVSQSGSSTYALTLSGINTYTGATTLGDYAWVKLAGDASMSNSSTVQVNGNSVLTLLSDQTIGSLASNAATASIQLGSYTLSAGGDNSSTTVSGVISGNGALIKQGNGTLTLAGSNTYMGSTTVSAGTLSIASDANLGAGNLILAGSTLDVSGATTIDNAITLTGNSSIGNASAVTLSGAISGAYDLSKTGSGTLTLSASNSYAATYVNAGTLSVSSDANLGSGAVNLAAGTTLALSGATTIDNAIVLGGNATLAASANATVSGVVSGAFTLTKAGASTLTLSGANTYGATTVSAGTLSVAGDANLGSGSVTLSSGTTLQVTGATTIDNNIALNGNATLNSAADTTLSGVISGSNNLTKTGAATLNLSGSNTYSGSTSVNAGTLSIANDANLGVGSLNLANGTTLQITGNTTIDNALALTGVATINASAAATLSGVISGSGGLTKSGSGSLTLSASNTNLGNTSVTAGTLIVDGSTNSATTVGSGATLAGSGTLGSDVVVQNGGTLAPGGAGVGTLTVNGNLTLNAGSTLALDINGSIAGTGYDRVVVNGTVDVSGATLAVTHGYAAGSGDNYTVIVNDAADAVTGTFNGVSEGSQFNAAGNGTELTTSYIGGSGNDLTLTAPIAPTVTSVSSSSANGTYKIGDVITVTVQFSSAVDVTGTPTLTLETGTTDRVLNYVSGSGSNSLSFSYTVQAGDSSADLDYVSSSALSLNGGSIQYGTSQSAILTLPTPGAAGSLGANKALVVDGVRPAATSITLSDTALRIGETATVTVTFNEAVLGLDLADFSVANGTLSGLSSSDGGLTWTATFTPSSNITDASNIITLSNSGVMDLAGNIGSGSTDSANYAIDTQRPTASILVADSALKAGQSTTVTITFSEAVSGLTLVDFSVANGTLSNLSTSDNITWTATLTPSANVTDTTNLITLDNTGYSDAAGNAGTGTTDSNNYAIDTQRPSASIVVADTALNAGQSTTVTITFSEAVSGLTTADFSVANGALSGLGSSDGGLTWTATLTPSTDVVDATNLITLDNTGFTDAAGNTGTGTTDSNNYAIDSKAPVVISVGVPANGTYMAGDALDFTVNFDEAVTVDTTGGIPRLAITLDTGGTVFANYLSGSGSTTLVFRLTISNGQQDSDGISVNTQLQPNGSMLTDAAGNNALTALVGVGNSAGVLVDAAPPQVTTIVLDTTSPTTGSTLGFTVTFSEDVSGVDLADFSLSTTGSASGSLVSLVQVDGRTYRVTVGDVSGQGTLGLSLAAAGSGITDAVGNALQDNYSTVGYTLGELNAGDPEFRANPTPIVPPPATPLIAPVVPSAPPPGMTSPLLPLPLFEQPTLGSGIPTMGSIFINRGELAPSYIAQVFASSDSGVGNGSGVGFLGFGGGHAGVFGTSSLSSIFTRDVPMETEELQIRWGGSGGNGTAGSDIAGAPTLSQQLHEISDSEQRQVSELAWALGQMPLKMQEA